MPIGEACPNEFELPAACHSKHHFLPMTINAHVEPRHPIHIYRGSF
jgi:hypothetical protein